MLSLTEPAWLGALVLVPALRWLHRRSDPETRIVSSASLWGADAEAPPVRDSGTPPDPAWRRRAAMIALLACAAAGPSVGRSTAPINVWIDDSLSMRTREADGTLRSRRDSTDTRLAHALERVRAALEVEAATAVTFRALSNPAQVLARDDLRAAGAALAARAPAEAALRVPPPLARGERHWVATDGADRHVNAWIVSAPIERALTAGVMRANSAVGRIAARASLADATRVVVDVEVRRYLDASTRGLVLSDGVTELERAQVEGSEWRVLRFDVPRPRGVLRARLLPADALAEDDALELAPDTLHGTTVAVRPACAGPLSAAIAVDAGVIPVSLDATAEVTFSCGNDAATRAGANVRMRQLPPEAAASVLAWSSTAASELDLSADEIGAHARATPLAVDPADRVLMWSPGGPAIVRRAATGSIDVGVDLADPALASSAAFPVLVANLVALAGRRSDSGAAPSLARAPEEGAIAPRADLAARGSTARRAPRPLDLTVALLIAAGALLLLDLLRTRARIAVAAG